MKIKKLEIVGFKSFVDQATVHFDHDITCVVGPNGCGKSNIVDAIKWVMGEQSPSRLRGKQMEDVIFSGAEGRGPHGFAEVTITFDNTDGLAPPEYRDYAEIQVSRKLDRQGRSDYLINRTAVRLMDVTNLFLGTGVGKRAYSIIEQGRIGFIVTSKPEDRRNMIEEAAGVSKFRLRKRTAERKMEQTRQNLLRVTDIIGELERSLASLKRQAQKAERYKRYKKEMRDLDLYVASHRYLELRGQLSSVSGSLVEIDEEVRSSRTALASKEASVEAERVELQRLTVEVERRQGAAYELDNMVRQLEGLIRQQEERRSSFADRERLAAQELAEIDAQRESLAEKAKSLGIALQDLEGAEADAVRSLEDASAELESRKERADEADQTLGTARSTFGEEQAKCVRAEAVLDGFDAQREALRTQVSRLSEEREALGPRRVEFSQQRAALEARIAGLRSGKVETAERRKEIEDALCSEREELQQADANAESLREELAIVRSRLRSLTEIHERFEGVGAGARALMTSTDGLSLVGLVADRVECDPHYRRALGAALGAALEYVLVEDTDAALQGIDFLMQNEKGRAAFLPRHPRTEARIVPQFPTGEGVVGPLLGFVRHAANDGDWVRHLLHDALVVDSLAAAARLHSNGFDGTLVSLDGQALLNDGRVVGGAKDETGTHLLEMKAEMRELEQRTAAIQATLDKAVEVQGELRTRIAEGQAAIDSARTAAHDAEIETLGVERDLRAIDVELDRIDARQQEIDELEGGARAALAAIDVDEETARRTLQDLHSRVQHAAEAVETAQSVLLERRRVLDEQLARVTEVKVRATQTRERAERERSMLEQLERSTADLAAREERLIGESEMARREQGQAAGRILLQQGRLSETAHEAAAARQDLSALRAELDAAQSEVAHSEASLKDLRGAIDRQSAELNALTLKEREIDLSIEHLKEQVLARHRIELDHVICEYHTRPIPDASVSTRAEELQRLIDRMGEINLTAIEEYEENAQRYEYLTGQRADLEDALGKLESAIKQMNRESRTLFREAFAGINERFKRIFPMLFRGGKGELRLSDPHNLLETGVEIAAQPPGKRLGSLELMSGGEKALTAVALIFAIFQYKPSPFCLLDEVDAPLDEANIGRFAQAIMQMTDRSQFIIITHSKRTMEYADVLYGVTMEQPGISKLVSVELRGERRPFPEEEEASVAAE